MLEEGGALRERAEWLASRAEHLCTRGPRYVTGSDIIRISRRLALEPWHLTQAAPAAADDATGILTDGGRRCVTLRLANGPQGCVFLLRTFGGAGHCGLGELAPVSCRVFPVDLGEGVAPLPGTTAPAKTNSAEAASASKKSHAAGNVTNEAQSRAEEGLGQEMLAEVKQWAADRDLWFEVVKRWNALVAESGFGDEFGIDDFQRYLLEAHVAREAGAAWPEESAR